MNWLPKELTHRLHVFVSERAEDECITDHYAFMSGYYRSVVDTLPDTPENREHIENTIKRLKERQ